VRAIWKGTISFGLVNIPIALGIATQRSDPRFRTLERETGQPIRQVLVSSATDERVERDDTIKGYEVSKDRFLPILDDELESVAVERHRNIEIEGFVDVEEIDPVFYDRSYYVEPQERAEKPYALFLAALRETGKAAVGRIVMSSKEYLTLLRPAGDSLVVELLFYPEDVRSKGEIEERVRDADVKDAELEMAKQLVTSLARPFEPSEFRNQHKQEVLDLIDRKLAGEEVPIVREAPAPAAVPDLMAALKASLAQAQGGAEDEKGDGDGAKKSSSRSSAKDGGTKRGSKPKDSNGSSGGRRKASAKSS